MKTTPARIGAAMPGVDASPLTGEKVLQALKGDLV